MQTVKPVVLLAEDNEVFRTGKPLHKQETLPIHGEPRHFDTYKIPLKKPDGTIYALMGATRDITPIIELQQQLAERTTELETLMNTLPDQIWMVEKQSGTYVYCNDQFAHDYHHDDRLGVRGKTAIDLHGPQKGALYMEHNKEVFDSLKEKIRKSYEL